MPRTDRASRVIDAPVDRVFDALVDREALERWLPPVGMAARFERFDPTSGGSYRLVLTYTDPADSPGKSATAGTMTMTWAVREVDGGTRVEITADGVPGGISADDHAAGMSSSLDNLARHLEP
jgi:uncharacterized protein YndB with AHSA1/START domain